MSIVLKLTRGDLHMKNHKEYRRIKKHKFNSSIIILVFICILLLLGISYSAWTTTLTVSGTATAEQSSENKIPVEILPDTPGGDDFAGITVTNNALTVTSQTIEGNTLTISMKSATTTGKPRTMQLSMNFKNASNVAYTNGAVTYEITGNNGFIGKNPSATVTTTIAPSDSGTLTTNFSSLKFNALTSDVTCKFTITYDPNRTFYVVLVFSK